MKNKILLFILSLIIVTLFVYLFSYVIDVVYYDYFVKNGLIDRVIEIIQVNFVPSFKTYNPLSKFTYKLLPSYLLCLIVSVPLITIYLITTYLIYTKKQNKKMINYAND